MSLQKYKKVKSAILDEDINKFLDKGYEIYKVAQVYTKTLETEVKQMQHWLGLPK